MIVYIYTCIYMWYNYIWVIVCWWTSWWIWMNKLVWPHVVTSLEWCLGFSPTYFTCQCCWGDLNGGNDRILTSTSWKNLEVHHSNWPQGNQWKSIKALNSWMIDTPFSTGDLSQTIHWQGVNPWSPIPMGRFGTNSWAKASDLSSLTSTWVVREKRDGLRFWVAGLNNYDGSWNLIPDLKYR